MDEISAGGRAIIVNVPLSPRLRVKDVVATFRGPDGRRMAGEVVWRGYERVTTVRYSKQGDRAAVQARYDQLRAACIEANLVIEGFVAGIAAVCHHDDTDLLALFERSGIDTSQLRLEKDQPDAEK